MSFKKYTLQQLATIKYGKNQKAVESEYGSIPIYGTGGLMGYSSKALYDKPSVLIGRKGTIDKVHYVDHPFWTVDTLFYTEIKTDIILPRYFYYAMTQVDLAKLNEGTTIPSLRTETLNRIDFNIPSITEQRRRIDLLISLEEKISINDKINQNLEQQVLSVYDNMFIKKNNSQRTECRADELFDISIGKTPPRKEPQWFSNNPCDQVWVSISDMGSCGMFISDSSEYITSEAVNKFNVKLVPDNTVILSFKLTVGRIAITDGVVTTNEAIAHFITNDTRITEYLYCYLKNFNYQTMGSTSSIATAVNSKIIKGMNFVVPTSEELDSFHDYSAPFFELIKINKRENLKLSSLRDSLLPKLMSGEMDVSEIDI